MLVLGITGDDEDVIKNTIREDAAADQHKSNFLYWTIGLAAVGAAGAALYVTRKGKKGRKKRR